MLTQENLQTETPYLLHRRFDRMGRLVGDAGMEKLFQSSVTIIGLGGVGSWAAESLARSGVGNINLVDFDEVCITNANRQLQALQGNVGKKKVSVLAERLRKINPQARIQETNLFFNHETADQILNPRPDYILDAIDNLTAKSFLLSSCQKLNIPVVSSTGAAARLDPLKVQLTDLSETHTDPMAAQLRKILRTDYDFPRQGSMNVPTVFSAETPMDPVELHYDLGKGFQCVCPQGQNSPHSCDRRNVIWGTASFVTGTFGLVMASWTVKQILNKDKIC